MATHTLATDWRPFFFFQHVPSAHDDALTTGTLPAPVVTTALHCRAAEHTS